MEKKRLGKTNLMVSPVAMGGIPIMRLEKGKAAKVVEEVLDLGINFVDTAWAYQDSEEKIGLALKGRNRHQVVIASKSQAVDQKTLIQHLDEGLTRLGTSYFDVYQLHNVSSDGIDTVMGPGGAYEGLCHAMDQGKVKYPGFSTHDRRVAVKLLNTHKFAVMQIPVNFIETEFLEEAVPLAEKLNVGIIAMKPMGGGLLEDANLALRYLMQYESLVPDPGIEKVEEMEEIIGIVENPRPITDEEKQRIEDIRRKLGPHFCHWCDYCQPCSEGITISLVLNVKSLAKRTPLRRLISKFGSAIEKAEECSECGECLERCPYKLAIPELLQENLAYYRELRKKMRYLD